ncbi:MAG: BlaI/MecI/CopY family transcriptional regulator [Vulcanimicrobiaceae bacterium]
MERVLMPRYHPRSLTKAELRIMRVLWKARRGSVADVVAAVGDPPLAYTTVLTMLRILEQKGFVSHEVEGRAHVYLPSVEEREAAKTAIGDLVKSFFSNKKTELALALMAEERPSDDELARIKELIARYESKDR